MTRATAPHQTHRDQSRDGLGNRFEFFLLTHFEAAWRLAQRHPALRRAINARLINSAIYKTTTRPHALSLMAPYTSWDSLTDRTFSGRHLPPSERDPATLPPLDQVTSLFARPPGRITLSRKSTALFAHFAQWFTDGFLRSDRSNLLKNTSNHEIDLCPVYGLNRQQTLLLRSGEGGRLRSQTTAGEEYPCFYFGEDGQPRDEFRALPTIFPDDLDQSRRRTLFALGSDRGNVQVGYVMFNVLFLREHNRICGLLARAYPAWDDERLFQTARNILIVVLTRIVIEEYINHIAPYHFKFLLDPRPFARERWYRQNWMAVEFNLLYRWHGLVTDRVVLGGREYPAHETLFNNDLVTGRGLGPLFEDASRQAAGEITLFNTPSFLLETERASIALGRHAQLASYNEYRALCRFPRVTEFNQITGRPEVQEALARVYRTVDDVELYVGLFAEDVRPNSALSPLIGRLVGVDALSQALTNPLLAPGVFTPRTFSPLGMDLIAETRSLSDILHRNVPDAGRRFLVTMTQPRGH
jgi:prostaglandin-endoperoxide synthase 2